MATFTKLNSGSWQAQVRLGKEPAREGAGPVTIGIDLGYIKTILSHAAAVHGVVLSVEPIVLARIALARLGLVGQGNERDRRPTQDELDSLVAAFEDQKIPVGRVIRSAVATAMRQDEISRIEWADFDPQKKMLLIRDRKDPRRKSGNSQANPSARHHRLRRHHRGATMLCRSEPRPDIPVQWKVCWNGVSTPVP